MSFGYRVGLACPVKERMFAMTQACVKRYCFCRPTCSTASKNFKDYDQA